MSEMNNAEVSRREFIGQMGIGKTAKFLGGLMGFGVFGSLGLEPKVSPEEAARELAHSPVRKSGYVAPLAPSKSVKGNSSSGKA